MDIINLLTIILVPIGILAAIYAIWSESNWSVVWSKSTWYVTDNTKSAYYQKYGFHEYDIMCDTSYHFCTFEIQKHKKTNEYRMKHKGDHTDFNLQEIAYDELNTLKRK